VSERTLHRARAAVAPRFRCLVCRVFVTGGEDGTCPRCGWTPPTVAPSRRTRVVVVPAWFVVVLLIALGMGGAAAALAL
jgi:hypothetical protein